MKLGGLAIMEQFRTANWRAYRHNELIPLDELEKLTGPNSVDATLHRDILIPRFGDDPVDPHNPDSISWIKGQIEESGFILPPGEMVLGAVRERFVCSAPVVTVLSCRGYAELEILSHFAPMCEGRSTCGRLGIEVHLSAGFGDYGFGGAFTLEIKNNLKAPVILYANMRIAQIAFEEVYSPKTYRGAYSEENHYDGPVQPKLGKDRF